MGQRAATPGFRARILTGTYTGNAADPRNIDIGVDLASKENIYIWIGANATYTCVERAECGQGNLSKYDGQPFAAGLIKGLVSVGFQIGSHNNVNQTGVTYWYAVMWSEP